MNLYARCISRQTMVSSQLLTCIRGVVQNAKQIEFMVIWLVRGCGWLVVGRASCPTKDFVRIAKINPRLSPRNLDLPNGRVPFILHLALISRKKMFRLSLSFKSPATPIQLG